jgi:hypothetical protein
VSSYKDEKKWAWISVALWAIWGAIFLLLEWVGLGHGGDDWPPLTYVFRRFVWAPLAVCLTVWLLHHVLQTYFGMPGSGWVVAGVAFAVGVGLTVLVGVR